MKNLKGVSKLEKLFRTVGKFDIDKADVLRLNHFINDVTHRLLQTGMENTSLNNRDVIWISDLPITQGLKNSMKEFEKHNEEINIENILADLAMLPPLKYEIGQDIEEELPKLQGGLIVALIKSMRIMDEKKKNPQTEDWEKAISMFETLL